MCSSSLSAQPRFWASQAGWATPWFAFPALQRAAQQASSHRPLLSSFQLRWIEHHGSPQTQSDPISDSHRLQYPKQALISLLSFSSSYMPQCVLLSCRFASCPHSKGISWADVYLFHLNYDNFVSESGILCPKVAFCAPKSGILCPKKWHSVPRKWHSVPHTKNIIKTYHRSIPSLLHTSHTQDRCKVRKLGFNS